jgi:hypothetical protein
MARQRLALAHASDGTIQRQADVGGAARAHSVIRMGDSGSPSDEVFLKAQAVLSGKVPLIACD